MNIFVIYLTGIIPAGVIIAVGLHILHTGQEETAKARFFTFLLTTGILLLFAIFTAGWLTPDGDNRLVIIIAPLLTPSLLGVLALILIHIKTFADLTPGGKVIAFLLALSCLALIAGSWQQPTGWAQVILPGSLLLAITWTLASASQKFAALFSLVIILLLTLLNTDILSDLRMQFLPHGFAVILGYFLGMLPGFAVTLAAVFTTSGFRFLKQSTKTVSEGVKPTISTRAVFQPYGERKFLCAGASRHVRCFFNRVGSILPPPDGRARRPHSNSHRTLPDSHGQLPNPTRRVGSR
jgi:hypothetical protein